jgi:hypothetical protein
MASSMYPKERTDSRESFMLLYQELYDHASFLEDTLTRLIRCQKVDRARVESHLAQILASIAQSNKKHLTHRYSRKGKNKASNEFHNEMVKVTKVVKEQTAILLKSSFLTEHGNPGVEYIQTFSDMHENILVAFHHVIQTNIFVPISLN